MVWRPPYEHFALFFVGSRHCHMSIRFTAFRFPLFLTLTAWLLWVPKTDGQGTFAEGEASQAWSMEAERQNTIHHNPFLWGRDAGMGGGSVMFFLRRVSKFLGPDPNFEGQICTDLKHACSSLEASHP